MTDHATPWHAAQHSADVHGHIAQLWVYPIKSCAGVPMPRVQLHASGLAHDREWMLVDAQGHFMSQRAHPRMVLICPQLLAQPGGAVALRLNAPEMPAHTVQPPADAQPREVQVWDDRVIAHDQGDAAAQWLGTFLGTPCRLVRFDGAHQRPCSAKWTAGVPAHTLFADGYPLLLATEAAGDALSQRVQAQAGGGGPGAALLRFRANVVLGGLEAHEEDYLEQLHVHAGQALVTLRPVKPCVRCPIPDIDPATAERTDAVGHALRSYRADARMGGAITFGMNAIVTQGAGAVLQVGQPVAGVLAFA